MSLEEKACKQFRALTEFFDKENLHHFLDDVDMYCKKEAKYLKISENEEAYRKLCMFRHIEQVDSLYKDVVRVNYAMDNILFPMYYTKRTEDEIDTIVKEKYGVK